MNSVAPRLPAVLGSSVALLVVFVSFLAQVSPMVCVMRATAAFVVFAAFGVVIRYLLADEAGKPRAEGADALDADEADEIDQIAPGTSVGELLPSEERHDADTAGLEVQ